MAGETTITIVGNLVNDPEIRYTASGAAVANMTIASTPRSFDKQTNKWVDQDALFMRCSIWRNAAENAAESLRKGTRVVVTGRLKSRSYETREGEKRTVIELEVEEIGASLKFATVTVNRPDRDKVSSGGGFSRGKAGDGGDDPWATSPPMGVSDGEAPF